MALKVKKQKKKVAKPKVRMSPAVGVILAAGRGARIDRTDSPKPLVKVGGKELIVRNIEQMQEAGIKKIFVVLGYRGAEIEKLLTNNPHVKAELTFVHQSDHSPRGLIKSLLALPRLKSPAYLAMADLVLERNPYKLFGSKDLVSVLVDSRADAVNSGAGSKIKIDSAKVFKIGKSLQDYDAYEIGVYRFEPKAFEATLRLSPAARANFQAALQSLASRGIVGVRELGEGFWFDVNTPATQIKAEIALRDKRSTRGAVAKSLSHRDPNGRFNRPHYMSSDIHVEHGLLGKLSSFVVVPESKFGSVHFLLTDKLVDSLHATKVIKALEKNGLYIEKLVVEPGEHSKNMNEYVRLGEEMFSKGLDKHSYIISLGGGVVNNIAGFLASTLYRGIGLIHIPTTTMAQVDAAIDFKQAVNSHQGKNLFGSYYPAQKILIDTSVLNTLDERHFYNGLAESLKHALAQDPAFIDYLFAKAASIRSKDTIEEVTRRSIALKVPLLNGDPSNDYNEMIPQYGHSIGHAIEHLSGYDLLHGEAVAIGMCVSAEVARIIGIGSPKALESHYKLISLYKLPTKVPENISADDICNVLRFDKHHLEKSPHMALLEEVGRPFCERSTYAIPIDYEIIRKAVALNKSR